MSAGPVVAERVCEDAKALDGSAGDAGEAGAEVDVGDVHRCGLGAFHASVRYDGGALAGGEGDGLEERAVGGLGEEDHVAVGVREVDAERAALVRAGAGEDAAGVDGPGVGEVRAAAGELVVDLEVAHVALDGVRADVRELMHEARLCGGKSRHWDAQLLLHHAQRAVGRIPAERILSGERRVEEERAAHLGASVVPAGEH